MVQTTDVSIKCSICDRRLFKKIGNFWKICFSCKKCGYQIGTWKKENTWDIWFFQDDNNNWGTCGPSTAIFEQRNLKSLEEALRWLKLQSFT